MQKEKAAKALVMEESLDGYERAVLAASPFTSGEKAANRKVFSEALASALNAKVRKKDAKDGSVSDMTAAQIIAVRMTARLMLCPDPAKVKDAMSILGDLGPTEVTANVSVVDEDLRSRSLGKDDGGKDPR